MPERPIRCQERQPIKTSADVHPGWIRATGILLIGLERLRRRENEALKIEEENRR